MRVSQCLRAIFLIIAGTLGLSLSQWFIFIYAPIEQTMGPIQKIFYIHLPLSWWGLASFFVVFVSSIAFLVTRKPGYDRLAQAAAEIGVLMATLCLVTGIIWGRRSWGVWWTWDPRLSTALVMWFIYIGYLILNTLALSSERRAKVKAVVGIIAFIDVPLVFLSARMWRSIHPAVFGSNGGGLDPEMKLTAVICIIAMGLLWGGMLELRKAQLEHNALADRLLWAMNERSEQNYD